MKVKSVVKVATVYYYVETDEETFPEYRRSESGNWERHMGESWEPWDATDTLEKAYQEYQAGQPRFNLAEMARLVKHRNIDDGIYRIEHIDADHVRLTKEE